MSLPLRFRRKRTRMVIALVAWLVGGVLWAAGALLLLHLRKTRFDHDERMAEIQAARAQQDEDIERSRAERRERTRPDLAEALAKLDGDTEVFAPVAKPDTTPATSTATDLAGVQIDAEVGIGVTEVPRWPDDLDDASDQGNNGPRHRLPSAL